MQRKDPPDQHAERPHHVLPPPGLRAHFPSSSGDVCGQRPRAGRWGSRSHRGQGRQDPLSAQHSQGQGGCDGPSELAECPGKGDTEWFRIDTPPDQQADHQGNDRQQRPDTWSPDLVGANASGSSSARIPSSVADTIGACTSSQCPCRSSFCGDCAGTQCGNPRLLQLQRYLRSASEWLHWPGSQTQLC